MRIAALVIFLLLATAAVAQDYEVEDQSELKRNENPDEKIRKNLFLRAEVSKTECYVGENLMAAFKAYTRLHTDLRVVQRPSLSGFSVIEMVDTYNSRAETEKYNGINYSTHLIRKVQLFALRPGDFTLEAAEVEGVVRLTKPKQETAFKRIFGSNKLIRELQLKTPPVNIKVKPLPEKGQPENFSGAVGQFNIDLRIKDSVVKQYQPVISELIISGAGNIALITDPEIKWPVNNVPDPKVIESINHYQFPLAGSKVFEYRLSSRDTGNFTIPPIAFNYFDPQKKEYKIIFTKPVNYKVVAADNTDTPQIITGRGPAFPLHYFYFGIIVAGIIGVIIYQFVKKK